MTVCSPSVVSNTKSIVLDSSLYETDFTNWSLGMSIVPTIASPTFNVYCKLFVFSNTIVAPRPCTSSSNAISFSSLYVGLLSLPFRLIETCAEPRSTLSHLETIAMFTEVPFFVLPRIVSWFFNTIALRPGFSEVATSVYSTLVDNTSLIADILASTSSAF